MKNFALIALLIVSFACTEQPVSSFEAPSEMGTLTAQNDIRLLPRDQLAGVPPKGYAFTPTKALLARLEAGAREGNLKEFSTTTTNITTVLLAMGETPYIAVKYYLSSGEAKTFYAKLKESDGDWMLSASMPTDEEVGTITSNTSASIAQTNGVTWFICGSPTGCCDMTYDSKNERLLCGGGCEGCYLKVWQD